MVRLRAFPVVGLACVLGGGWGGPAAAQQRHDDTDAQRARRTALVEEIAVTARRREEAPSDVPIAMSVLGADDIASAGLYALGQSPQLVPALHVFGFNPRATSISIRGLGGNAGLANDGLENGVGVFVDQVYIGRVGPALFELADLERIEVLRGPQGTLTGKNTTAGAVNVVTKAPSFARTERTFFASVGDYGFRQVKGTASGPLGDKVAGRVSVADTHRDGFIENAHTGADAQDFDNFTARGQLLVAPTGVLEVRLIADYARQKLHCCVNVAIDLFEQLDNGVPVPDNYLVRSARLGYTPLPFEPFDRQVDLDTRYAADMRQHGLSAQITRPFAGFELTSITAYREWDWNPSNDADETALPVVTTAGQQNRQRQWSQELRMAPRGERRIDFVAGLYFFDQSLDGYAPFTYGPAAPDWFFPPTSTVPLEVREAALDGFGSVSRWSPRTHSSALFGQAVWKLNEKLDFTAGARVTHDRLSGSYEQVQVRGADLAALSPAAAAAARSIRSSFNGEVAYDARLEDDNVSGTLNVAYRFAADALGYFTYSRGAKSGGLNLANLPPGISPIVDAEKVDHYEVGAKTGWLDGAVGVEVAIFRSLVSDYQTSVLEQASAGGRVVQYISNIDEARSEGIEVDARWAFLARFGLSAGVAYADTVYASYPNGPCPVEVSLTVAQCDLSGQPLAGAPKRAWSLALDGTFALRSGLEAHARVDYGRRSDVYTSASNSRYSRAEGYGLVNLRFGVRLPKRDWDVTAWVTNVTDEEYFQLMTGRNTGLVNGVPGEPRTFGIAFGGDW